jgi:hypothetical protein
LKMLHCNKKAGFEQPAVVCKMVTKLHGREGQAQSFRYSFMRDFAAIGV